MVAICRPDDAVRDDNYFTMNITYDITSVNALPSIYKADVPLPVRYYVSQDYHTNDKYSKMLRYPTSSSLSSFFGPGDPCNTTGPVPWRQNQ